MTHKSIIRLNILFALASPVLCGATDNRAPELPPVAASLAAPEGNKVHFHVYAAGVQIYIATPSAADPTRFV